MTQHVRRRPSRIGVPTADRYTWEAAAAAHLEMYRTQLRVHQEWPAEVAGWEALRTL